MHSLSRDPEKCEAVFRKDHAQRELKRDNFSIEPVADNAIFRFSGSRLSHSGSAAHNQLPRQDEQSERGMNARMNGANLIVACAGLRNLTLPAHLNRVAMPATTLAKILS